MHLEKKVESMHVVYLPRWYPHKYDPMPGLFIERHGLAVAEHCNVSVLYVHPDEQLKKEKFIIDWGEQDTLPTIRIYYKKFTSGIQSFDTIVNACRFYRFHRKGLKLIREKYGKPDLIHVHVLSRHGVIAWLQKIFKGIPYVITEHWTRYLPSTGTYGGRLRKWFTSRVARNASAIMPVTANLRDAMINCGLKNDNYVIIPNVVDVEMFYPSPHHTNEGKKRIIHVSCFEDKQKNISGILRVIKRISEERQDFICEMIGDGIHYEQLVKQGEQLGLKGKFVVFFGLKENEELAEMMRNADFMIMFSNYENLPVVILESYACGVPVISTDVGGIREHLDSRLGKLIKALDEQAFYQEINNMLDHPDQYDKQVIRQYSVDHFSNEVIGKQLFTVYQDAVRKR